MLFVLWLAATLFAAHYFISARLVAFDPDNRLISVNSSELIEQMAQLSVLEDNELTNTLIHITSENCACSIYSKKHKQDVSQQAKAQGLSVLNVNLPETYNSIIPSTPAALIIDNTGQLIYFGPYSEGLACSSSNGYIELAMQNYQQGYSANLIVADSKGCYCKV